MTLRSIAKLSGRDWQIEKKAPTKRIICPRKSTRQQLSQSNGDFEFTLPSIWNLSSAYLMVFPVIQFKKIQWQHTAYTRQCALERIHSGAETFPFAGDGNGWGGSGGGGVDSNALHLKYTDKLLCSLPVVYATISVRCFSSHIDLVRASMIN